MKKIQLTETSPDVEIVDKMLHAQVFVWHKNNTTLRVTILVGGISRMFDATKTRIREKRI